MQANMQYIRDAEGYMVNPEDWDEDFARQIAAEEDLELTEEYWSIIHFMRDFWEQQRIAPDVRHVIKHLVETHGYDKKLAKERKLTAAIAKAKEAQAISGKTKYEEFVVNDFLAYLYTQNLRAVATRPRASL